MKKLKTAHLPGGDVHAMNGNNYTVCGCYCKPTERRPWAFSERDRRDISCSSCDRKLDAERRQIA